MADRQAGPTAVVANGIEDQPYAAYIRRSYFPPLDGLRAFCVIAVIAHHMADDGPWRWLSGGLGVTVFYILSGYLITMLALREERRDHGFSLKAFYIRRSFRIFPVYYVVLACMCVLAFGTTVWRPASRAAFTAALPAYTFYYQEFQFAAERAQGQISPFSPTWSLGVEEKFYLVWPLVAFVLLARYRAMRLAFAIFFYGLAISLEDTLRLMGRSLFEWEIIVRAYGSIMLGCIMAILLDEEKCFRYLRVLGRPFIQVFLAIGLVGVLLSIHPFGGVIRSLYAVFGLLAAMLLASLVTGAGPASSLLSLPVLRFIGGRSYSMYLVHVVAIGAATRMAPYLAKGFLGDVIALLVAIGLSLFLAYVLGVLIEQPCIGIGKRWSKRILDCKQESLALSQATPIHRATEPVAPVQSLPAAIGTEGAG